ncbi:hypothetical protein [Cryptosporangium japonicum]|uniref:Uncharacterized protein n=1 Tax=Cryptosporangium japonicum TaxID=80872 RepID=A0ABP3EMC5_9ACTN
MSPDPVDAPRPDPTPSPEPDRGAGDPAGVPASEAPPKKSSQARDEIRNNAQNPRQAAAANRNLRDARAVFGSGGTQISGDASVDGDVISRDKIVYQVFGTNRSVATYIIDTASTAAFAEGPGYPELQTLLVDRRVILLQAPRGHGKAAAALSALLGAGYPDLRRYDPDVTTDDVVNSLRENTGYLIDDLTEVSARRLTVRALEDLETKLESCRAHLVVTIGDGVTFTDPGIHRFVQQLGAPASVDAVYHAHLRHHLGPDRAAPVIALTEISSLFAAEVPASAALSRAAEFARHVAELERRGKVDPHLLRTRMRRDVRREVESWFVDLPGSQLRCLAVALSLLDGLPYETVVAAADELRLRLEPPLPPGSLNAPPPADRFADSKTQRMGRLRADLFAEAANSPFGEVPAQLIRYRDPAYPGEVLGLVWREYDDARDDFQHWLRAMGDHPSEIVRIRAATAVGLLSLEAFDLLHRTVLQPWATSDSVNQREMAAYALQQPGTSDSLRKQVIALVDDWTSDSSPELQEVVARVYGAALGTEAPEHALEQLGVLADTEHFEVAFAIGKSLAEIVEADDTRTTSVLESILNWLSDDELTRRLTGQVAFLRLAADLRTAGPDGDEAEWPLLLRLADDDEPLRRQLARAWRETLLGRPLHEAAASMIGVWAGLAEQSASARAALATLLAMVADGQRRATRTVDYLARGWRTRHDNDPAERTAAAVLDALT